MKNISALLHSNIRFKRIIPMLIVVLKTHVGQKKAITGKNLLSIVRKKIPALSSRELRFAIHEIRTNHFIKGLIAGNKGYYIERNKDKITAYYKRISAYIRSMQYIKQALADDLNNL